MVLNKLTLEEAKHYLAIAQHVQSFQGSDNIKINCSSKYGVLIISLVNNGKSAGQIKIPFFHEDGSIKMSLQNAEGEAVWVNEINHSVFMAMLKKLSSWVTK